MAWIVDESVGAARRRRALIPWVVFGLAALPAMAGALGSSGVALLAPLAMRVAERCAIDRRMIGLMVVHGAAAGNFSPLNVLGAIVHQAVTSRGLEMSVWTLFAGNLIYNLVLGVDHRSRCSAAGACDGADCRRRRRRPVGSRDARRHGAAVARLDQTCTLVALAVVAIVTLGFGLRDRIRRVRGRGDSPSRLSEIERRRREARSPGASSCSCAAS